MRAPILFLFVDGIGLGPPGLNNPLSEQWLGFEQLSNGNKWITESATTLSTDSVFKAIDANLNVDGLPQSGTGQVSLFTGVNASSHIDRHFGPYPHSKTKPILEEYSLFKEVKSLGGSCAFLNAYPPRFFEIAESRNRWSTTTLMCRYAEVSLRTVDDVIEGKAVTAEILQDYWEEKLGMKVPRITEKHAAERAWKIAGKNHVTLYEYYLTDKAGHSQSPEEARHALQRLDNFLLHVHEMRPENATIILSSDHGNIEDLGTKTHTRNPVPLAVKGPGAKYFYECESILDLKSSILATLR